MKPTKSEVIETQAELKADASKGPIDSMDDYRHAVSEAELDGLEYIEVTDRVFDKIRPGAKTLDTFVTGPGLMVYRSGTNAKDRHESITNMSAEEYMSFAHQERRAKRPL